MGQLLHLQLEISHIPEGNRDHITPTNEPMPERIFPTFRDEAAPPTNHDLRGQIRAVIVRTCFRIMNGEPVVRLHLGCTD